MTTSARALPFVSVVMPVYNEATYLEPCIESLLRQDYPKEKMEWLFVDGASTDATPRILEKYRAKYPQLIHVLDNPKRTVPIAMNIGIRASKAEIVIRLDGHSTYAENYISLCVHYLQTTDAVNVGGIARTKSRGELGAVIAKLLSSRFGVGNSQFRTGKKSGYVDTVPFGAFRREIFEQIGLYDEALTRNQDNELNYRIRKNGGKIYLAKDIRFSYYGRSTVSELLKMARQNGKWNVITMRRMPGSMGLRHFVPLVFVLSLLLLPLLALVHPVFRWLLFAELCAYALLDVIASTLAASGGRELAWLLLLFPLFHINYGWGSLLGLWHEFGPRRRKEAEGGRS